MRATSASRPTTSARTSSAMVRALGEVLDTSRDRVLVVDDSSPDGTGEIADGLAAELPWVGCSIASARKGSAARTSPASGTFLRGESEYVLEMDCDFSHDPARRAEADRCRDDGPTWRSALATSPAAARANWSLLRRFISRGGSLYAQILLERRRP